MGRVFLFVIRITIFTKSIYHQKLTYMEIKLTVDCKGLSCPMPMMKLAKAVKELSSGEVLEMLGTDPGTKSDLPKWCEKTGNIMLEESDMGGGVFRFLIKKA